jgi:hypothetical protein
MISFLHPKGSDYYLLHYLNEELPSLESLLNRHNSRYDFYCYRNLTFFDKDGNIKMIPRIIIRTFLGHQLEKKYLMQPEFKIF